MISYFIPLFDNHTTISPICCKISSIKDMFNNGGLNGLLLKDFYMPDLERIFYGGLRILIIIAWLAAIPTILYIPYYCWFGEAETHCSGCPHGQRSSTIMYAAHPPMHPYIYGGK
jgi:hypothetical protein